MTPVVTTLAWVPPFARGLVRDLRVRWALEEVGQTYDVELVSQPDAKQRDYCRRQPFGQVPLYRDEAGELFESGAIVLRIAERAGQLLPDDDSGRLRAIQWLIAALNSVEPFVMALAINDIFEADREWSKARHSKVVEDLNGRLADLARAIEGRTWLDSEAFTIGDLMMISVLGNLRRTRRLDAYPTLAAYVARGQDRPAHRKAMADQLALYADDAA